MSITEAELAEAKSKKTTAGICALLVGGFGVHKFILGKTTAGVIMLLTSCTMIPTVIGWVEGIIYLTKPDEEFYTTYIKGDKAWF